MAGMTDSAMNEVEVRNLPIEGDGAPTALSRTVTYAYTPDKLNRSSVTENGVTTAYSPPTSLNQYTSVGGETFSYDGNFNLTHAGGFNGIYDAANRLVSASDTGASPPVLAEFVYDGLGRCVKRTIGGVVTLFAYDGWKPIAEWNQLQAWNVYGPGPDEILLRHEVKYGYLRFHTDRHGNVAFLLDNDGEVIEKYTYDAFGVPTITSADGDPRDFSHFNHCFLFQGREYIQELGIYDYRHRFYHPGLGRFLQGDPIGLQTEGQKLTAGQKALFSPGGAAPEAFSSSEVNLFRYCGDDPVDGSDPTGLITIIIPGLGPQRDRGGNWSNEIFINRALKLFKDGRVFSRDEMNAAKQEIDSARAHGDKTLNIVGYSLGGAAGVKLAGELGKAGIAVDTLVTIDIVRAPGYDSSSLPNPVVIPSNVKQAFNYYQQTGGFHPTNFKGTPVTGANVLVNK